MLTELALGCFAMKSQTPFFHLGTSFLNSVHIKMAHSALCSTGLPKGPSQVTVGSILLWVQTYLHCPHMLIIILSHILSQPYFCLSGWNYHTLLLNTSCSFKNHKKIPPRLSVSLPLYTMPELSLGTWRPEISWTFVLILQIKFHLQRKVALHHASLASVLLTLGEKLSWWCFLRYFSAGVPLPRCPSCYTLAQLWPKAVPELRKFKSETQVH